MPYTPPSARSPATTTQPSPCQTKTSSPTLPRSNSSSYISKHRRSPSFQNSPQGNGGTSFGSDHASIRQSPPPVTDTKMPAGAILSPPDSPQETSDDDAVPSKQYERQLDGLQELEQAVRSMDFNRQTGSPPNGSTDSRNRPDLHIDLPKNASGTTDFASPAPPTPPRLSSSARKASHSRSNTESALLDYKQSHSLQPSLANSDESEEDEDSSSKPPLLRKKSGELVKPAIRPRSRRKHSSMPGTPTYSKAVHFNDEIEQVKHFLQVDRPIAVSAGTSPVDPHDEETGFPFGYQPLQDVDWDIKLTNFPRDSFERMSAPVRVESLSLSPDHGNLVGVVAVANLAFHKHVVTRFTLDHWKTTSEVVAEYNNDKRQSSRQDGYDSFTFAIKVSDRTNLESKTLMLCVRYNVNGREFWDNNSSRNYQVDFIRKSKTGVTEKPANETKPIPRSRHNSRSANRPRSVPSFDDDFSSSLDHGSGIRFRNGMKSKDDPDPLLQRRHPPYGYQFGGRYDFGASLSAALTQAQTQQGERDGINASGSDTAERNKSRVPASMERTGYVRSSSGTESPRPDALLANNKSLDSRAYQDFVSRFCFFGSSKSSNQPPSEQSSNQSADQSSHTSIGNDGTTEQHSTNLIHDFGPGPAVEATKEDSNQQGTSSPLPTSGSCIVPRAASPGSFGYPFTMESRSGMFSGGSQSPPPTVIQG